MKAHGIVEASCQLWDSRPFNRGSTLQQGHLGRLASVDREREPQRRIERDSKHVVAEVPNLIRSLALRLRHETGALQEELERQRLPAVQLQRLVAPHRATIPPPSARCHCTRLPTVEHNAPAENGCDRCRYWARAVPFGSLLCPSANAGSEVFEGQYDVCRRPSGLKNRASR